MERMCHLRNIASDYQKKPDYQKVWIPQDEQRFLCYTMLRKRQKYSKYVPLQQQLNLSIKAELAALDWWAIVVDPWIPDAS